MISTLEVDCSGGKLKRGLGLSRRIPNRGVPFDIGYEEPGANRVETCGRYFERLLCRNKSIL